MKKNNDIFAGLAADVLKKRKKAPQPDFIPPMLATLTDHYFSSNEWIYEHKFDGQRCLAIKRKGVVHLLSRNNRHINNEYPELARAIAAQKADNFIIDGEIVAVTNKGFSDFESLQSRINLKDELHIKTKEKQVPIALCVFDVLYADGYDLQHLPLLARKQILEKLLIYNKLLMYTQHKVGNGIAYFHSACKKGWEGLIAKRADSIYMQKRSRDWLKFKCIMKQELVIAGYTESRGSRTDFGALLVGYYDQGKLMYAGKVGTGYSSETLQLLGKKLRALEVSKCPFVNYDASTLRVHWVRPQLVAEFQFAQWTKAGKLRVGRYKGLRTDKKAKDVVKEIPK
jgi:DNA ligase D-like protein (predicted ligase)